MPTPRPLPFPPLCPSPTSSLTSPSTPPLHPLMLSQTSCIPNPISNSNPALFLSNSLSPILPPSLQLHPSLPSPPHLFSPTFVLIPHSIFPSDIIPSSLGRIFPYTRYPLWSSISLINTLARSWTVLHTLPVCRKIPELCHQDKMFRIGSSLDKPSAPNSIWPL